MVLLIDTTKEHLGKKIAEKLRENTQRTVEFELIDTTGMNILNCAGCNYCWLKTPGQCVMKDDYEPILKKINKADQVWLISDTRFGFVSYRTKNIVDRVMPIVTMNLHFVGKQMRHILRYEKNPDWGLIYTGDGDKDYLSIWLIRVAINFGTSSLGAYEYGQFREAVKCMR